MAGAEAFPGGLGDVRDVGDAPDDAAAAAVNAAADVAPEGAASPVEAEQLRRRRGMSGTPKEDDTTTGDGSVSLTRRRWSWVVVWGALEDRMSIIAAVAN